jgi:hypothetical protein
MMRHAAMIRKHPVLLRGRSLVVALVFIVAATSGALAQQNTPTTNPRVNFLDAARAQASAPPQPPAQPAHPISTEQAIYLVRSTLLTLNDANSSGNYTVLRDLAAPDFQTKNTAADLAQVFADLRRRNFDLFAVAILAPQFTTAPALDAGGRARLTGLFSTRPLQISFDLTFQSVAEQWRLFAISVATPEAPWTHSQLRPTGAAPKAKRGIMKTTWTRVSANPVALTLGRTF